LSRKKRGRKRQISSTENKEKTALDALKAVQLLQNNNKPRVIEAVTQAVPGMVGQAAGSNDLSHEDPTGGSLQWYEKLHDEKISNVETRLGAQTTEKLYEVKSELEEKISNLRDSGSKHTVNIIITIIITFIVAFLAFYFSALESIENNVINYFSGNVNKLENQIIDLQLKVDNIERVKMKNPSQGDNGMTKKEID
jgi:hypothetical protein